MTEIMCIVAAVCSALSLIVSLLVLKNQKRTPLAEGKTEDTGLLQQLDRANYIAEQNAKNTQNYLNYLGQQQGEKLQGVQDKLEALNSATERRLAEIQRVVSGEIRYMAEQNAKNLEQIPRNGGRKALFHPRKQAEQELFHHQRTAGSRL